MKYRLYTTSQKAWDGMLAAISQAKKSIYLEMYSLQKIRSLPMTFWAF